MVVILPPSQTQADLADPDVQFGSLADLETYSPLFCDEELTSPKAYITAEFGDDLYPESMEFEVGGEGSKSPNDNPDYTNGLLCYDARYIFFVRAYPSRLSLQVKKDLIFSMLYDKLHNVFLTE